MSAALTAEAVAESIAEHLTNQLDGDARAHGVAGPIDGNRILVLLHGNEVLTIDVTLAEVLPR